jgi:ParB/RepB/Spo0J family partition protein
MNLPPPLSAHQLATADAQAEHALTDGYYGQFELNKLRPSPDNRKRFNEQALQELAASIKTMGVAQAILIRPVTPTAESPEPFEIVAGERRFRASKIAGKATIPALCRQLTDLDAAKIRILENLQREDPHPMEEAEGYQLLMLQHGFTADQLVDEVKKSRAYIYGRLKLCALTTEVREQFLDDKVPASTALLIARIPVPALQIRALGEILKPPAWMSSEAMSYRQAVQHVQSNYMLDLKTAVFKVADSKLLIAAGACNSCLKRTGNQPEVFAGVSADVCTDPDCFREKRAAHYAATVVKANKQGIPVLEGDEGKKVLPNNWDASSEFVTDTHSLYNFPRNAPTTKNHGSPKDYLDEKTLPPVAKYVKREDGALTPLYLRTAMQAALEAAGVCETTDAHGARMAALEASPDAQAAKSAHEKKREAEEAGWNALKEKAERETAYRVELYKRLRRRASSGFCLQSLRELTKLALQEHPLPTDLLGDEYDFDGTGDTAAATFIEQAGLAQVQLLLIDLLVGETLSVDRWHIQHKHHLDDGFQSVLAMARHEGIDPDAVREELQPTPIDVSKMGGSDLTAFISKYPQRLGELTTIIMSHRRGELVGMLETACNLLGYTWSGHQWVKGDDQTGDGQTQAEPTTASSDQVDMAQADNEPTPGIMHQVEHRLIANETTPAAPAHVNGEQLAEQMLEAMSAAPSPAAPEKKTSKKATPAKATGKAKPAAAATKTASKPAPKKAAASKTASSKTAEAA